MDQDKSAVEEFLGDIGKPKDDPFTSVDPFAPKNEEKKTDVEDIVEDEKPIPFHKDPKITRFIEKEISKRLSDIKPTHETRPSSDEQDDMTAVLERVIGNDTAEKVQAVKDFRRMLGTLEEKGAQRAMDQIRQQSEAQVEEERRTQAQLDESFDAIEDTYGVDLSSNTPQARKTRSEFVDYIRKIAPKNDDGEVSAFPDLNAAFEEYQERSKRVAPTNAQAKALASRGVAKSSDTTVAPKASGKSWRDIDKLFGNLTS